MTRFRNLQSGVDRVKTRDTRRLKKQRRRPRVERLERRHLLAANLFHNELLPEDVNEDGQVSPLDALTVITRLGRQHGDNASTSKDPRPREPGRMTDVNNDGRDSPIDALLVINRLSRDRHAHPPTDPNNDEDNGNPDSVTDPPEDLRSDAVIAWNDWFGEILSDSDAGYQTPGDASRTMAMLNLAIYDAVALASDGADADTFYDYEFELGGIETLSAGTTASFAAHTVLSDLYPEMQSRLDGLLSKATEHRSGEIVDISETIGVEIGNHILQARANDGTDVIGDYTYGDAPGDFQPDPLNPDVPAWGPTWGQSQTFVISSSDDYRPDSPPELSSDVYAEHYNEVLELGSADSSVRTADQTEAGIFWAYDRAGMGTPMALYNDILQTVAIEQGNSLQENAALFAQASVAMADAGITAWDTKFSEEFWRPVTAIHDGDSDGNSLTDGDPEWIALGAPDGGVDKIGFTPQFPTYISGHATFGGALFGTLQEFYGTDEIAFDVISEELTILLDNPELQEAYGIDLDDATRSFSSFSEAMEENGRSRVYLGIHFAFDDLVGQAVGQSIAASVASEFVVASNCPQRPDEVRRLGNGQNQDQDHHLLAPGPQNAPSVRPQNHEHLETVDSVFTDNLF
ncbi:dockerin type I domain-containing protein [Roseiconus lacunae]|uniref:dockerin type I domain-containing protein n=1 Tax=Roseiconus lacunae TaxID=2605694 RepID=UPI0011F0BBBD|nr:dockerin type I domain-containing protein [Roseiconus lacunae]